MNRMGINIHVEDPPPVAETCFKDCKPTEQQLKHLAMVLISGGEVALAIISSATSVNITSRCSGKNNGQCAMESVCKASIGEAELAKQEVSASELGA